MDTIYLDHAATTPLDPEVLEAMMPMLKGDYGNASSIHKIGRKARFHVDTSRERVAELLGAEPSEIIFTSGGTEANNLAISGARTAARPGILTSAAEHEAVLQPVEQLRGCGVPVKVLTPSQHGSVTPGQVDEALTGDMTADMTDDTTGDIGLVSLMHVNNEVGTVTDIAGVAEVCRSHGVKLHCDAVQSAGLFALNVDELGADLLTISGHKFYGPKGVGILYVRGGVELNPEIVGGSQERARRGGTENVAAIAGFAAALDRAYGAAQERAGRIEALRNRLHDDLRERLGERFITNTPIGQAPTAPHVLNVSFPPQDGESVDGEMLLLNMDMGGVCLSAGSACTSGALEPSHVLMAMGLERPTAAASLRFSLGKDTTAEDVTRAAEVLDGVLKRMGVAGRTAEAVRSV